MLSVEEIDVYYGNIQAIRQVSLEVRDGEMVALVGPNGAGKSTTLKTISGLLRPTAGTVSFEGQQLNRMAAPKIVELGVAQVPEGRGLFPGLSVVENLRMGHYVRRRDGKLKEGLDLVFEHFPRLAERRGQLAGTLSGGEQQMMVMGRALLSRPKLLLIDEPSLGLAPVIVQQLFHILADINKREGTAMLLVEQFVQLALRYTSRAYVLAKGGVSLMGDSADLLQDTDLVSASYMGAEAASKASTNGAGAPKGEPEPDEEFAPPPVPKPAKPRAKKTNGAGAPKGEPEPDEEFAPPPVPRPAKPRAKKPAAGAGAPKSEPEAEEEFAPPPVPRPAKPRAKKPAAGAGAPKSEPEAEEEFAPPPVPRPAKPGAKKPAARKAVKTKSKPKTKAKPEPSDAAAPSGENS